MTDITSINNQQVKNWKKLHTRKERKKTSSYLIEGYHLVEEAIQYKREDIQQVIAREDILQDPEYLSLDLDSIQVISVSDKVASEISDTETNQGIFAVLQIKHVSSIENVHAPFLLLDAVQDPGNVGTMIRTADAAGFQGVILGTGTVDLYNSKTLRSAQGSHFHLEIYEGNLEEYITKLKTHQVTIFGTHLNEEAESYKNVDETEPFALIVGNEGSGIRNELMPYIDKNIYIPMKGQAESLNVAIAASILMFHLN